MDAPEALLQGTDWCEGVTHTLSNGQSVTLPSHDEFYRQLTLRNRGLINAEDQKRLRRATILVAGCGSVGGAVIEPFIRMGAERMILAEPDGYDLHNLNRQSVRLQDIGRNKAECFRERMLDINPYACIDVDKRGIVEENVEDLVRGATLIIDAVDVTTRAPLRAKFALHQQAKRFGVPVLTGYDVGGLQLVWVYDYRKASEEVLHGRVRAEEIGRLEPVEFLQRVVPLAAVPYEIIPELRRQIPGDFNEFPQVVYTANLFGVLVLPAALDLLASRAIRRRVIVDVPTLLRPRRNRLRIRVARFFALMQMKREYNRRHRALDRARRAAYPVDDRPLTPLGSQLSVPG